MHYNAIYKIIFQFKDCSKIIWFHHISYFLFNYNIHILMVEPILELIFKYNNFIISFI